MNGATSNSYEARVEAAEGLERRMTIRVPAADIEREIDARLVKVGQTAKLKGFRPGKVPQKVVRKYYGGQVRDEVLTDVVRATYARAIADQPAESRAAIAAGGFEDFRARTMAGWARGEADAD